MNPNEKIIDRIKKLLELATSSNEHEATLAMEQASRLMAKYSITNASLNDTERKEVIEIFIYNSPYINKTGLIQQLPSIMGTIGPIFGVYPMFVASRTGSIRESQLIGYPTNIKVAIHAIESVINQGLLDYRLAFRLNGSPLFGLEFWDGFAKGLQAKFAKYGLESDEVAMVVYDAVKNFVKARTSGSVKLQNFDGSGRSSGYESGQKASLRSGIASQSKGNLLK
jgi:hypothetical protein